MKKIIFPVVLLWLLILPVAYSQQKGIVEGRVINRTDPSIIARSVELDVVELGMGMRTIKTATTDSAGKFRVEGLPENARMMIRAIYKEVNYHQLFSTDGTGKATIEIAVYEPTTSMKDIQVESCRMAFEMVGDQLKSLETITFRNKTNPPRTYMNPAGNYRFSKGSGIVEPPKMRITAPGSSMPVIQAPLESPDGQSYYTLYPLKPGVTTFEVQQLLPYTNHSYVYIKRFYQDIVSMDIGVTPSDMALSGQGLSKASTDTQQNFSVYIISAPIKAGSEARWTFSGGTPVAEQASPETTGNSNIEAELNAVGRNAPVIASLLLMGFVLVLWAAFSRAQKDPQKAGNLRNRELKERRDQLLNTIADLDHRHEIQVLGRQEYLQQREEGKRQLRRISLLLKM
jgi:hypothetical protein